MATCDTCEADKPHLLECDECLLVVCRACPCLCVEDEEDDDDDDDDDDEEEDTV